MTIIDKSINDITEYENNPRYNDKSVEYVARSIKTFGFRVPIVIDKDGVIAAGHTRYKAAISLGMKTVPCIIADDLTEEQVNAFRLADNRTAELSSWDFVAIDKELADLRDAGINMEDFGFPIMGGLDLDSFIKDEQYHEDEETEDIPEKKHKFVKCPHCGEKVEL